MTKEMHVGWLVAGVLRCDACTPSQRSEDEARPIPVYHVNIYPYRGRCAACSKVLVAPQTPAWPDLFTKQNKRRKS